jgi:hypothetical protein
MTIYRGTGGGGDATVDTELNQFVTLKDQAASSAASASADASLVSTLYDSFDDRYLGSKSSAPSVDNDGNALLEGALYWNSVENSMNVYNGTSWVTFGYGATGTGGDQVFFENDQAVTTNYTITTGKNAMSAGPVTVNSGVTVTIPSGSVWTIV